MQTDMSDIGNALRSTSDSLIRDLEELNTLEAEKRALAPGSPRLLDLAAEIEAIAGRLVASTTRQRVLSERVEDLVAEGDPDAPSRPIEATPREIHVILAEWREVERQAGEAAPGTPEAAVAAKRSAELRDEYRLAHEAARQRKDRGPRG